MPMLDLLVVAAFFLLMVLIGAVSYRRVRASADFFVAGGKVPWWLGGISHHVSGYSGVVFVLYAGIAYEHGLTIYVWWACSIAVACLAGAYLFAPRWSRLREYLRVESPTEYLLLRYNRPTQQLMAWSGVILKLFDVGAKWASIGILLHGFTGLPITVGIFVSGGVSLLYIVVGGLWADLYTDLAQFVVQIVAGLVLFVAVAAHLGGMSGVWTLWERLPEGHADAFNGPFGPGFALAFLAVAFFSYNGGTWNLAARYMAAPNGKSARKAAILSGGLYAIWPLVLFFPMWAAPILLPDIADPSQSYAQLVREFLPAGLVGLVLAAMFANTMSMTTSDANTVSAVITRDILPFHARRLRDLTPWGSLLAARVATVVFVLLTLVVAVERERFGDVFGLILSWFGALVGPVAVPMLFGLLPVFRPAGPRTAIASILAGFGTFATVAYLVEGGAALRLGAPVAVAAVVFVAGAFLAKSHPARSDLEGLMEAMRRP